MKISTDKSRRSFLSNCGKVMTLPFLGSLLSSADQAAAEEKLAQNPVSRLLWMAIGHGHMEEHFYPKSTGALKGMKLPPGWSPLQKNLAHMSMISNFSNMQNKQPHDGSEALLTCANVVGFPGKSRHNSISCDQIAAAHLGQNNRYESLQLNCPKKGEGNGHGGVAISYRKDGSPLPGFDSPLQVFHKLFGGNISKEEQLKALQAKRSIFDIMKFESGTSKKVLNKEDAEKLDEYTSSIRDIELAISREKLWVDVPYPKATVPAPKGNLSGEASIRIMFKMIIAAYQTDATRVITYRMPDAELLKSMGFSSSPHTLSHYGNSSVRHKLNLERTKKWMQLYSYFIDLLRSAKDSLDPNGRTIYENTLAYLGGGLRTAHRTENVPCLLTGGGFKGLKHGHHRKAPKENTPLANLWLTMMQDAGAQVKKFADSNGTAKAIFNA